MTLAGVIGIHTQESQKLQTCELTRSADNYRNAKLKYAKAYLKLCYRLHQNSHSIVLASKTNTAYAASLLIYQFTIHKIFTPATHTRCEGCPPDGLHAPYQHQTELAPRWHKSNTDHVSLAAAPGHMTEQLLAGENWGTEKGNEGTIFG
jgi:hypothetical protein